MPTVIERYVIYLIVWNMVNTCIGLMLKSYANTYLNDFFYVLLILHAMYVMFLPLEKAEVLILNHRQTCGFSTKKHSKSLEEKAAFYVALSLIMSGLNIIFVWFLFEIKLILLFMLLNVVFVGVYIKYVDYIIKKTQKST